MKVRFFSRTVLLSATCLLFWGCGTNSSTMSAQDKANFSKGGPMPPDEAQIMAKQQADMKANEPASFKAWEAQRATELARRGAPGDSPSPKSTP